MTKQTFVENSKPSLPVQAGNVLQPLGQAVANPCLTLTAPDSWPEDAQNALRSVTAMWMGFLSQSSPELIERASVVAAGAANSFGIDNFPESLREAMTLIKVGVDD